MRQKLGLVCRHINVHRAFGAASLACQTQIEGVLDRFAFPAAALRIALKHLEEQMRPAASRVGILASHHVARAHRAGIVFSALSHTDAPFGGIGKTTLVMRELEMGLDLRRVIVRAQSQVFARLKWIDDLVRIHAIVRVPDSP